MKKTFIFYADRQDYLEVLNTDEKACLLDALVQYHNWIDPEIIWWVVYIRPRIKKQIDENIKKYEEVCEKRKESWKLGWRPVNKQKNQMVSDKSKWKQKNLENDNDNVNENIVSKDTTIPNGIDNIPNSLDNSSLSIPPIPTLSPKRSDIDELIAELKDECDKQWIAYEKKMDRQYAKHILDAKEYWEFVTKVWQDRVKFAINVLRASVMIKYFKWACSWPMSIYQNYSEVYNQAKMKSTKKENVWNLTPVGL